MSDLDGELNAVWQERLEVLEAVIQQTEATVARSNELVAQTKCRLEALRQIHAAVEAAGERRAAPPGGQGGDEPVPPADR